MRGLQNGVVLSFKSSQHTDYQIVGAVHVEYESKVRKPTTWAYGIVRTIGWVNFLDDGSQQPRMKLTVIDTAFGVGESTGRWKSMLIREILKIRPMDPA